MNTNGTWVRQPPDDVDGFGDGGDDDLGAAVRHGGEARPLPRARVVALGLSDKVPHAVRVRRVVVDAAGHVQFLFKATNNSNDLSSNENNNAQ